MTNVSNDDVADEPLQVWLRRDVSSEEDAEPLSRITRRRRPGWDRGDCGIVGPRQGLQTPRGAATAG